MTTAVVAGYGQCQVCHCTDLDGCPGGCVWANAQATLCSRCAQGGGNLAEDLDEGRTYHDNLEAAMQLGGFEGGVLPTLELDDGEDIPW